MQHVFEIEDGGEFYLWSAKTLLEALNTHEAYMKQCGAGSDPNSASRRRDRERMTFEGIEKTCAEWAAETIGKPVPMVGTTAV